MSHWWYQPYVFAAVAGFDPAPFAGAYQPEAPQYWQRWSLPPHELNGEGLTPPAEAPFDPAPFAGAYQFDHQFPILAARWYQPPDAYEGLVPPAEEEFDPAPFAGAYQPDLSIIPPQTWAVPPELPWEGLEPPAAAPFDPAPFAGAFQDDTHGAWLNPSYYQPEDAFEGLEPPAEPEIPLLVPPVMVGGIGEVIGDRLLARTHIWYQNDWHAPIIPFDPAIQGPHSTPDLSVQDQWNWPRWYQPEDAAEGLEPPAETPFDPAPFSGAYQADLHDLWLPARWFIPEDDWTGLVPPAPPAFDPAPFSGAYQGEYHERWIQPVWRHPDDDWTGLVPPAVAFDPAPFAGLFGLDAPAVPLRWQIVLDTEAGPLVNPEALLAGLWVDETPVRLPSWWTPNLDGADGTAATLGVEPSFLGGFPPSGVAYNALVANAASTAPPASVAGSQTPAGEASADVPAGSARGTPTEGH